MSAADKRIAELLDRWLASIELHARYVELDDAAYAKAQDWPKHQRPTRWVVELARTRLLDLKRHVSEREARGDATFAEALELMGFLTTLLGAEHIERFIPLATKKPAAPPRATHEVPDRVTATVIADAVRFLAWGREWPQLASLIARLANRPGEQQVLQILRQHRAAIEAQATKSPN